MRVELAWLKPDHSQLWLSYGLAKLHRQIVPLEL